MTDAVNRPKLNEVNACPPIVTVAGVKGQGLVRGDFSFWAELDNYPPVCEPLMLTGEDPFLLMFTSGTTGPAKPLLVPLKAIVAFQSYTLDAVDLRPEDSFWNLADPGWAYGIYFGIAGPLSMGHPITLYDGPFTVESTCRVIKIRHHQPHRLAHGISHADCRRQCILEQGQRPVACRQQRR